MLPRCFLPWPRPLRDGLGLFHVTTRIASSEIDTRCWRRPEPCPDRGHDRRSLARQRVAPPSTREDLAVRQRPSRTISKTYLDQLYVICPKTIKRYEPLVSHMRTPMTRYGSRKVGLEAGGDPPINEALCADAHDRHPTGERSKPVACGPRRASAPRRSASPRSGRAARLVYAGPVRPPCSGAGRGELPALFGLDESRIGLFCPAGTADTSPDRAASEDGSQPVIRPCRVLRSCQRRGSAVVGQRLHPLHRPAAAEAHVAAPLCSPSRIARVLLCCRGSNAPIFLVALRDPAGLRHGWQPAPRKRPRSACSRLMGFELGHIHLGLKNGQSKSDNSENCATARSESLPLSPASAIP